MMIRRCNYSLFLILAIALAGNLFGQDLVIPEEPHVALEMSEGLTAYAAETPLTIDGDLSDWIAAGAEFRLIGDGPEDVFRDQSENNSWDGPEDLSILFSIMWDDENLYFGAVVWDDILIPVANENAPWESDMTFLFIDGNSDNTQDNRLGLFSFEGEAAIGYFQGVTENSGEEIAYVFDDNLGDGGRFIELSYPLQAMTSMPTQSRESFRLSVGMEEGYLPGEITTGNDGEMFITLDGLSPDGTTEGNYFEVTFEGNETEVYVESVSIEDAIIDENNGTVQILATVLPENADKKTLEWSIKNKTGKGTIDANGVVSGLIDGTVEVYAIATDGSYAEDYCTVTISNQIVTRSEINMIRNGYFEELNAEGKPLEWNTWGEPVVEEGVYIVTPETGDNIWDFRLQQLGPWGINAEDDYTLSFKLWADDAATMNVDFEDAQGSYLRYGTSTHILSNGRSDWTFQTETEPTKYVFDIEFVDWTEERNEQFHFMMGHCEPTVYIDSVELFNNNDLDRLTEYIPVTSITVKGDNVLEIGASALMSADILPAEADYTAVKWSVINGTGYATITEDGMLSADSAGMVTVVALACDDSKVEGVMDVSIGANGIWQKSMDALKVYPNPAVNELYVVLRSENTRVCIYNGIGQKMNEKVVSGTEYRFDISSYAPGIYFVKTGTAMATFVK